MCRASEYTHCGAPQICRYRHYKNECITALESSDANQVRNAILPVVHLIQYTIQGYKSTSNCAVIPGDIVVGKPLKITLGKAMCKYARIPHEEAPR